MKPADANIEDQATKDYLKSLQKWIQENAKSGEQAWQMFWEAFQQQQKSLGNWNDDDQKLFEHHQSTGAGFLKFEIKLKIGIWIYLCSFLVI